MANLINRFILFKTFLQSNWKTIIFLILSVPFIIGGTINRGWSGFFCAIPFLVIYVSLVLRFTLSQRVFSIIILVLICLPFAWEKESNTILYPFLGAKAEFKTNWGYVQYSDSDNYSLISPDRIKFYAEQSNIELTLYIKPLEMLKQSSQMKLVEVDVSNSDFVHKLRPIFEDKSGRKYSVNQNDLFLGIREGTIISEDLKSVGRLDSSWTAFLANLMYWPIFPSIIFS